MRTKRINASDPRMKKAIRELKETILNRYPDAEFEVYAGEDPEGIYMEAKVDLEDPSEILDLVGSRVTDLNVDEGLPIHVIPGIPWSRVLEQLQGRKQG